MYADNRKPGETRTGTGIEIFSIRIEPGCISKNLQPVLENFARNQPIPNPGFNQLKKQIETGKKDGNLLFLGEKPKEIHAQVWQKPFKDTIPHSNTTIITKTL